MNYNIKSNGNRKSERNSDDEEKRNSQHKEKKNTKNSKSPIYGNIVLTACVQSIYYKSMLNF